MRRIPLVLAAFALLVSAAPALAANGCGSGFDLKSIDETLERVDDRIYDSEEWTAISALIAAEDTNGDTLLCSKLFAPNRGQDKQWIGPEDGTISDYVITLIMDNRAVGRGS